MKMNGGLIMQTLDAPVYEVNQDSEWYQKMLKRNNDIMEFFKEIKEQYGLGEGFSFYHSEYFGIRSGTKDYDRYKGELLKNPDKNGFYPFKKRSKYFQPIKALIEKVEQVSPFTSHDVFGLNNITASQWVGDRWFFGVKKEKLVKGTEVTPIDFKEYLKLVIDTLNEKEDSDGQR
jgi:hypothetical protein